MWVSSFTYNKLASLKATLVQNPDPACDPTTSVECRATSVAKKWNPTIRMRNSSPSPRSLPRVTKNPDDSK